MTAVLANATVRNHSRDSGSGEGYGGEDPSNPEREGSLFGIWRGLHVHKRIKVEIANREQRIRLGGGEPFGNHSIFILHQPRKGDPSQNFGPWHFKNYLVTTD